MPDRVARTEPMKLSPTMTSRKLLTLKFIRQYFADHDGSPSLSEIAEGIGVSRRRALDHVQTLARERRIGRRPGPRGIYLIDAPPFTDSHLTRVIVLDYVPSDERGRKTG